MRSAKIAFSPKSLLGANFRFMLVLWGVTLLGCRVTAQTVDLEVSPQSSPPAAPSSQTPSAPTNQPPSAAGPSGASAPLTLTLADALERARANSVEFRTALVERGIAHQDKVQARAAMLPTVTWNNQYLYTQGNGTPSGRFIANNGVHEYLSEGNAHEDINLGLGQVAEYRRAAAAEALAKAKAEVATRGLVVAVSKAYYDLVVSQRKYATAQNATSEAQRFLTISQDLEQGGEVAHSDVIKAQLQFNDRQRDLQEARLAMGKTRLALAVLLFPNFRQDFTVVDDLATAPPLPPREEVHQLASKNNVDLRAAMAALQVSQHEVGVARSKYLPTLSLDYWYGIDSNHFAVRSPLLVEGRFALVRNLGYSASAILNIPIWNWGTTQSKIRQAELRRSLAQLQLTTAQKQLLANLQAFYDEAEAARSQLEMLRNSADLAAESLRLTRLRYQAGEVTMLEVVDAQNTLTTARNNFADGEARYRVAIAQLQTLTGNF